MQRRLTASIFMAGALMLVAACDSAREPTAPPPADPSFSLNSNSSLDNQIEKLIPQLFPKPGLLIAAFIRFEAIEFLVRKDKMPAAKKQALELVAFAVQRYKNHQLIGNQSSETQAKLQAFMTLLLQYVGLGSAPIPPGALGPDGAIAVVGPTGGQVVTETQLAGTEFPAGALPQDVIVTISRSDNQVNPLPTNLPQFPVFYEFKTFPEVAQFSQPVTVAVCVLEPLPEGVNPANLRIAHQLHTDPTAIEILPLVNQTLIPSACAEGFPARKGLMNNLATAGKSVGQELLWLAMGAPKDLSATERGRTMMPGGLGGRTGSFSTFGAVDFTDSEFVPYQEQGYRYLQLGAGDTVPTGFALPSFNPSGWSTGTGAFGGSVSGSCPDLASSVHTAWPAASGGAVQILLRKRFSGSAQNVQVHVRIDNDVQVFVNGNNITATGGTVDADGFVEHEGCATPIDFTVNNSILLETGNLVVVRARDRGVASYVDVQVTGDLPAP